MELHLTDVLTYKSCRRKFRYSQILRLEPKDSTLALNVGKYGHELLAKHYGKDIEPECELDSQTKSYVEDLVELYKSETKDDWHKVLLVEQPITVYNFVEGIDLTFTIDLLVSKLNKTILIDHKFYERTPNADIVELNEQLTAYACLANLAGFKVDGVVLNCIVKKTFKKPQLLSGEKLSKAQSVLDSTTEKLYRSAVEENGLDENDYSDVLEMLASRPSGICARFPTVYKTKRELEVYESQLAKACSEIAELVEAGGKNSDFYTNVSMSCSACRYKQLCKYENSLSESEFRKFAEDDYRIKEENER